MATLLEVRNLRTHFFTPTGVVKAVDGVSYALEEGETLGLVGESGCGKSVSALSIMRLVPNPPGKTVGGEVIFEGQDLLKLSDAEIRRVRGRQIAMVYQEPMSSLNPVLSIGRQLTESLELHLRMSKADARREAVRRLEQVGIPDPERRLKQFPHHFSGGMLQRVMIAIALSCSPKLIIADEPTTALDVTIQAQILDLMKNLSKEYGVSLLIITHNLGVVARYADRVNIMYAGKIIERGTARDIYRKPGHPYTLGLLNSVPRLDLPRTDKLDPVDGQPPDLLQLPEGCAFRERCRFAMPRCAAETPPLHPVGAGHLSACFAAEALLSRAKERAA
ncbi:MAG TPA: ABC transporter ATP-binding protein [Xanthobacteraceae bacterium]|jgi:oligopeptide/dipeptide ABC transporter ATP-binding protein